MDLLDGEGLGGTLLGSSGPVVFSNSGFEMIHFDLLSSISLTPGNLYTLHVLYTGGDDFRVEFSSSNPYAGGIAFDPFGSAAPPVDLIFREGLHEVPEPASLVLVGIGECMAGAGAIRRRRREQSHFTLG